MAKRGWKRTNEEKNQLIGKMHKAERKLYNGLWKDAVAMGRLCLLQYLIDPTPALKSLAKFNKDSRKFAPRTSKRKRGTR